MTGTIVGVFLLGVVANGLNLFGVSPFWRPVALGSSSSPQSLSTAVPGGQLRSSGRTDRRCCQQWRDALTWPWLLASGHAQSNANPEESEMTDNESTKSSGTGSHRVAVRRALLLGGLASGFLFSVRPDLPCG